MSDFEIEVHLLGSAIQTSFSLRSKRFQSSYCVKVIHFFFCSCPSFLDEPRKETLATQATLLYECNPNKLNWHSFVVTRKKITRRLPSILFLWMTSIFGANHLSGTVRNGQKDMIFLKVTCTTRNMKNYVNNFKNSIICSLTKSC